MLATFTNDGAGPNIEIGLSIAQLTHQPIVPPSNIVWIRAIADTGASGTCICADAARRAGLPIIGKGNVQSASHVIPVNLFYGDLWIRGRIAGGAQFAWPFRNKTFTELALPGAGFEALLGMDVFAEGILLVHGPEGKTTFAW